VPFTFPCFASDSLRFLDEVDGHAVRCVECVRVESPDLAEDFLTEVGMFGNEISCFGFEESTFPVCFFEVAKIFEDSESIEMIVFDYVQFTINGPSFPSLFDPNPC
jgi:hypothetical protein